MTAPFQPQRLARPARRRRIVDDLLTGLPLAAVAGAIGWRWLGPGTAISLALFVVSVVGLIAARRVRQFDRAWLVRRLDAVRPDLDDSADLLFADEATLTSLGRLQRRRIERRLNAGPPPDLRLGWSTLRIAGAWFGGILAAAAILGLRHASAVGPAINAAEPVVVGIPHLVGARLRIVPPAYTGLPAREVTMLDVRAPQGSRLEWTLAFAPQPSAADLVLAGDERTTLTWSGAKWTARRVLDRPTLYRIVPRANVPLPPLHRLDAVADAPPQVQVVTPDRGLSVVTAGQKRWPLTFAASDDYGVGPVAQLHLTVAEGEGENVKFREIVVAIAGHGSATAKRFDAAPDLAALKFVAGSDLVAQLVVSDNRSPGPQTARSPSVILRWPGSEGAVSPGGLAVTTLPAYFRSERQIVIDAEALVKARPHLAAAKFLARSDGIGADQRLLRLRYGQFLGEEQEGTTPPPPALPTADAAPPQINDEPAPSKSAFGSEANTLADYGHVHDESEAATLLDPATRTALKAALDAMWQTELNLRQGRPAAALPFAYKALGLIKQVQQATRLFLSRVGPDLPVVDETRRLTGKRDGLVDRGLPSARATAADATPASVWQALATRAGATSAQLTALDVWLSTAPASVADPLALAAAIDSVRREPGCGGCRRALRGELWRTLPRPAAGVIPRAAGDAAGRRYLDALAGRP